MSNEKTKTSFQIRNAKTRKLVVCAMLIAIAVALSFVVIYHSPFGGSVTVLSMLPIVLIGYLYGVKWGFGSALVFGILKILVSMNTVSALFMPGDSQQIWWKAIIICLLDYVLAYAILGISSLFRRIGKPSAALGVGALVATVCRYIVHVVSGAIFYGEWAEWFFGELGETVADILAKYSGASLSILYSAVYNAVYMLPEIILTTVAAFIIGAVPYITKQADFDLK